MTDEEALMFAMVQRGYAALCSGDLKAAEEILSEALAVLHGRGGR